MPDQPPNPETPNMSVEKGSATFVGENLGIIKNKNTFVRLGSVTLRAGVPPVPEHYVPREAMMKALADQLSKGEQTTVTGRAVASGDGGHGKTVLARAYAHQFKARYPSGCFEVACETGSLVTALASLVPLDDATDEQRAQYAQAMLSREPRCLLILDNVRDAEQWNDPSFQDFLPHPPCHVLVTTRAEHLPGTREVMVGKLTRDEAFALLAKFRDSAGDAAHRQAIETILAEVERLAAVVAAVGALMMIDEDDDWSAYAEHLRKAPLSGLPDGSDAVRAETGYAGKTAQVLDDLRARLPAAEVRVLNYAALLPADKIVATWLEMLLAGDAKKKRGKRRLDLGRKPSGSSARTPADVIAHLKKLGLLTTAAEGDALLSVHRLHRRRATEIVQQQNKHRATLLDAVVALAGQRGEASRAAVTQPDLRPELTPLAALAGELDATGRFNAAVGLANWVHKPLRELGRYAESRNLLAPLAARCESEPDSVTPDEHGMLLSHLALILKALGDLPEARRLAERAIEIGEKHFAPDHPRLATSYSNLATILQGLGDLPEARRLTERAIEIDEKHFAPDHPILATSYNNLAMILKDLGDLAGARKAKERSIEIELKHLGEDHPQMGPSYSNLALILHALGKLPEARRLAERAIEIREKHFDLDHPTLATGYSNLAMIVYDLGELSEARRLTERAIEIDEKHFAPDHPILATSYNNLAMILKDLGDLAGARKAKERSIEIELKHLGEDHPQMGPSYSNLALILHALGKLPEARRLAERAIEIREKHFDLDHPTLATSYSNLAMIVYDLGELSEARRLTERAIEIDEKHFDPDHPRLATSYHNLAGIAFDEGKPAEARRLTERAIEIREKHFDPDHPALATSYSNLAAILQDLGDLPEARRLTERAIEIREKHFDPDHPDLATSYHNLAGIAFDEGKPAEAVAMEEKALPILLKHFDDDHPYVKISRAMLADYRLAAK